MRRWLVLLTSALILVSCGVPRARDYEQVSKDERIVIKFSHVVAENTPKGLAARRFATAVKKRTGGLVEVQVFPNSSLYKDGEEFDALRRNEIQIIAPSLSKLADIDPLWQVFDLPYLFTDLASVERIIAGSTGQRLYDTLRRKEMEPIAFWDNGFKVITNAERPLVRPHDVEGLRLRIQPSPVTRDSFVALGALVSVRSFDSLYGVLAKRELDGQENTASNILSKRIHEVQPYMTISNHGYLGYVVLVNQDFWNSLAPELRETLREAMTDVTQWVRENAGPMNDEALERIRASGEVKIYRQTQEERKEWRAAMDLAYQRAEERLGEEAVRTAVQEAEGKRQ